MDSGVGQVLQTFSKEVSQNIIQKGELPDWISLYPASSIIRFKRVFGNAAYPSKDNFTDWFREKRTLWEQAEYIKNLIPGGKVNIIELHHTKGDTCLPLLLEFAWEDRLHSYISAMVVSHLNILVKDQLGSALGEIGLSKTPMHSVDTNIEFDSFIKNMSTKLQSPEVRGHTNVFVLASSAMSHMTNDSAMLQRVHRVMQSDDYLVVSQLMHKPGNEADLVHQYKKYFIDKGPSPSLAHIVDAIDPGHELKIDWQEKPHYRGPTVYLNVSRTADTHFLHTDLHHKQQVTIFRTHRYTMDEINSLFERTGFTIKNIMLEEDQTNAVFILKKK